MIILEDDLISENFLVEFFFFFMIDDQLKFTIHVLLSSYISRAPIVFSNLLIS